MSIAGIVEQVQEAFVCSPKKSVRRASQQLNIHKSTLSKILRTRLKFHPYKMQLVHKLKPDDSAKDQISLPQNLQEVQLLITATIQSVSSDMLEHMWREWEYHLDICSITRGALIRGL